FSNVASKVQQISKSFLILPNIFKASIGNAINNISASFGNFLHQLKRIAMYRAIRTMFSQLTQGFREGMNNLYQYSLMMGGTFAGSMDSLAASAQYLRNSLGSMMAPIIKALVPAIDFLINKIATALNFINMLFARLSGASTFTIAKKSAKGFSNAVSGIGNSAKKAAKGFGGAAKDIGKSVKKASQEIHDATLGIDELNIITQKNNEDLGIGGKRGGGGSGLGGVGDVGGIDYGSMFEEVPISDSISNFIDRLKEAFHKADWKELGTLLGEKVNEAVDKINWSSIGHKLGDCINGSVQTVYWFLDTVNFNNIGSRIAELLNGAMQTIDFSFVGRMIIKPFTSAIDLVIGFLRKLDWELVGKSIKHSLIGLCDELIGWLNKYDWFGIGESFTQNLCKFIKGINVTQLAQKIGETLITATHNAIKLAAGVVNPTEKFFDTMKRKNEIEQQFGKEIGKHKFLTIPIVPAILASEYIGDSGAGLYQGMADGWKKKASKNICEFLAKVKNSSSEWWDNVKSWWNGVHDKTVQFSAKLIDNAQDWWRNAQSFWNGVSNKIVEFSARVINHASTWWQNVKDFWN
ncbi:MAG: hypothetical protein HUJ52_03635, partial [Malacoplasma sp.]|nr:hypothetical protein [Malacoplasma sp.]